MPTCCSGTFRFSPGELTWTSSRRCKRECVVFGRVESIRISARWKWLWLLVIWVGVCANGWAGNFWRGPSFALPRSGFGFHSDVSANLPSVQQIYSHAIDLEQLDSALDRLAQAAPPIKERIVAAACAVIAADKAVRLPEIELLRAVCAALDCPMPPVNLTA